MHQVDPIRYKAATAVFKLAAKTSDAGVHRTANRAPKGKGWVQCLNAAPGVMCRPEKVREAIEYFKIAYEVWPDIVTLNQIALSFEMMGDADSAAEYFRRMHQQADAEGNAVYADVAKRGLERNP